MTKHPKIPMGCRRLLPDEILRAKDRYWNYGTRQWEKTSFKGCPTTHLRTDFYIRRKPKPKVKPRKKTHVRGVQ